MRRIVIILTLAVLSTLGCSDLGSPPALSSSNPEWVNQLINQFQNAPVGTPPQSIWRYQYKGQTVYYVPPQCCDIFSILYDSAGNVMCAPDGGFGGTGDGHCPDFFQERTNELLVWKDSRAQ